MIIKYTEQEFAIAHNNDLLPLQCEYCGGIFYKKKSQIKFEITSIRGRFKFCNKTCFNEHQKNNNVIELICTFCAQNIKIKQSEYIRSKTKNFFCNSSCAASFNNKQRGHHSNETKQKIAKSLKKTKTLKEYVCIVCGKKYNKRIEGCTKKVCSKECSEFLRKNRKYFLNEETLLRLSEAGKKSIATQKEIRRSKNEIYFCYTLCYGVHFAPTCPKREQPLLRKGFSVCPQKTLSPQRSSVNSVKNSLTVSSLTSPLWAAVPPPSLPPAIWLKQA